MVTKLSPASLFYIFKIKVFITIFAVSLSKFPVGSSAKNYFGFCHNFAIDKRCCCPPLNSPTPWFIT